MKERPPPLVVLLVCGGDGVGKTALLNRLTSDMFISDSATLGPGLDIRNHRLGSVARLQLWEVGMCDSARAEVYAGVHGVMVLYDASEPASFAGVRTWLRLADRFAPANAVRMVVATKADTDDAYPSWHPPPGISFAVTSSRFGTGVDVAFTTIVHAALAARVHPRSPQRTPTTGGGRYHVATTPGGDLLSGEVVQLSTNRGSERTQTGAPLFIQCASSSGTVVGGLNPTLDLTTPTERFHTERGAAAERVATAERANAERLHAVTVAFGQAVPGRDANGRLGAERSAAERLEAEPLGARRSAAERLKAAERLQAVERGHLVRRRLSVDRPSIPPAGARGRGRENSGECGSRPPATEIQSPSADVQSPPIEIRSRPIEIRSPPAELDGSTPMVAPHDDETGPGPSIEPPPVPKSDVENEASLHRRSLAAMQVLHPKSHCTGCLWLHPYSHPHRTIDLT